MSDSLPRATSRLMIGATGKRVHQYWYDGYSVKNKVRMSIPIRVWTVDKLEWWKIETWNK